MDLVLSVHFQLESDGHQCRRQLPEIFLFWSCLLFMLDLHLRGAKVQCGCSQSGCMFCLPAGECHVVILECVRKVSYLLRVLLFVTHGQNTFLPINTFLFFLLTLCSFHPFFLSRLTFVQFGIHSVVSSYAWFIFFILCYLSWVYTFSIMFIPHCKYFFLSSCTRNMPHNAVNTRSQSLLHRKYTCTRPVRQMPFGVTSLKIEA